MKLEGKKYLVTGASSGIGASVATLLAEKGASLFITGRNEERLSNTYNQLGTFAQHDKIIADLNQEISIHALIETIEKIDGIVHCAGVVKLCPVKMITEKHIQEVFGINTFGSILLTSYLLRKKKINKGASIVFISSVASKYPYKGGAIYAASKAAIEAYSKTLALEYASKKIRSNCICAGMVKTPVLEQSKELLNVQENRETTHPLGFGEPIDVANAILYLLSDSSKWVTGTNMIVDGGFLAGSNV